MFPSLLESFGKISIGTSQDSQDKISEEVSSKSSTDSSRQRRLVVVLVLHWPLNTVTHLVDNIKCLIRAWLDITLSWRPPQNADNCKRIMMMSRSAFVMTYFLPDFHTRKNSANIYNVQIKMFIQASPLEFWKQIFQFSSPKVKMKINQSVILKIISSARALTQK